MFGCDENRIKIDVNFLLIDSCLEVNFFCLYCKPFNDSFRLYLNHSNLFPNISSNSDVLSQNSDFVSHNKGRSVYKIGDRNEMKLT